MSVTRPNNTGKPTEADSVQTPKFAVDFIFEHLKPTGSMLDPCCGDGAFYEAMKKITCDYNFCEIKMGKCFFDWKRPVDWIISNPPYSIYDLFLEHAFKVADNVVWLCPLSKAFKSNRVQSLVENYGGLKEIIYMGTGSKFGFSFGFPVGFLHYKRGFKGDIKWNFAAKEKKR